jgi:hypothetical protein
MSSSKEELYRALLEQTDQIYLEFIVATIAKKNFSNANEIPGYPGTQARRL